MSFDSVRPVRLRVTHTLTVAALGLGLMASGCESEAACEDAAAAVCARACACDDLCGIGTTTDENTSGFQAFSDKDECVQVLQEGCGETGTESITDEAYDACAADAEKAECNESGIELPSSCPL